MENVTIRDRIKDFRRVLGSEILPCPANWRTHPAAQREAMQGILEEVGIADALIVMETENGLQLIDGHLRADMAQDTEWPCLVLDVNESEAMKLLATFDPLAAMAEADSQKLDELLRSVQTGNGALAEMLTQLAEDNGLLAVLDIPEDLPEDAPAEVVADEHECPQCGHRFSG